MGPPLIPLWKFPRVHLPIGSFSKPSRHQEIISRLPETNRSRQDRGEIKKGCGLSGGKKNAEEGSYSNYFPRPVLWCGTENGLILPSIRVLAILGRCSRLGLGNGQGLSVCMCVAICRLSSLLAGLPLACHPKGHGFCH